MQIDKDKNSFKVIAATGQGSVFSLKKRLQELLTFQGHGKLRLRVNDISVLQIRFTDLNGVSVDMTHKDPEKITLYLDLSIRIWKKRVKLSSFTPEGIISDIETEQIIFLHEAQEHYTKQLRSGVCHNIIEKEIV